MGKFLRIIALLALALVSTSAHAQTIQNSAYAPNFPNVLVSPITKPRTDVEIPYIEVIRKDERTGLTYFFSFEELTPADIKYTRVPRYNPAQLFPNIALDLSRARAGDAVPVVNYTRNMIVSDGCRALRPDSDNTPRATFNPLDGGRVL